MKRALSLILCLLLLFSFISCTAENVILVEDSSSFVDFSVKDENVYIDCYITLKNNTNKQKTVYIKGDFTDDVEGRLLKDAELYVYDGEKREFVIEPNSETRFDITFVGEFGGTNVKQDRLLPKITIEEKD